MGKATDMMLALSSDERIRVISQQPTEDIIQALMERASYHEWMVNQIKDVINQPMWPEDKKPDVSIDLKTINQNLGGNENGKEC